MRTSRVLFACLVFFTSCHKKLGGFNPSATENFSTLKNRIPPSSENAKNADNLPEFIAIENEFLDYQTATVSLTDIDTESKTNSETLKIFQKNNFRSQQNFTKSSDLKADDNIRKSSRIKKRQIVNDSLKIGLIFLLISAGLAFLPVLSQLASLFALVSVVFLIIGLKKLFNRRMKEKKKKQRKENFELKKDKIKTFFNIK
jgi:hypothetical protein